MTAPTLNEFGSSMRTAAVTPVRAIIDPTDKSIPPEMTTTACATAARARGKTEIARPWSPGAP